MKLLLISAVLLFLKGVDVAAANFTHGEAQLKYFISQRLCLSDECSGLTAFGDEPSFFVGECVDENNKSGPFYLAIFPAGSETPHGKVYEDPTIVYSSREDFFEERLLSKYSYQTLRRRSETRYFLFSGFPVNFMDPQVSWSEGFGNLRIRKFDTEIIVEIMYNQLLEKGSKMCILERSTPRI